MIRRRWLSGIGPAIAACCVAAALAQTDTLRVAAFSTLQPGTVLPEFWRPLGVSSTRNRTRYMLIEEGGLTVMRADSAAAASGLIRQIKVNPAEYPRLKWRWKISNVLKNSNIHTKDGDDYPARIYVMFDYPLEKLSFADRTKLRIARALHDPNLPAATLCYVWDSNAPAGTIVSSSYTRLMRMIVVESGASRVNQWVEFERDVAADFRAAFGEGAPSVTAIAIATDTDNTGESVIAYYGDISFYKQKVTP